MAVSIPHEATTSAVAAAWIPAWFSAVHAQAKSLMVHPTDSVAASIAGLAQAGICATARPETAKRASAVNEYCILKDLIWYVDKLVFCL